MDILEIEKMIRSSISEEQDAISKYVERLSILEKSGDMSDNIKKLIETFKDVADEERVHVGEFTQMLKEFDISDDKEEEGEEEAKERDVEIEDKEESIVDESFNVLTESPEFRYMLLDRLRQDCLYYLGYGNRNEKNLWAGNPKEQIKLMKDLYKSLEDKPQWISLEEINDLENKMLNDESLSEADEEPKDENKISIDGVYQTLLLNMKINLGDIQLRPLNHNEFGVFNKNGDLINIADLTRGGVSDVLIDNGIINADDLDNYEESFKQDIKESLDHVRFDDYNKFKMINNYHAINPEKEKGCCDCQFVAFEGLVPICTYLGKSLFPDKEVRCDRTCDKFKQSKSK